MIQNSPTALRRKTPIFTTPGGVYPPGGAKTFHMTIYRYRDPTCLSLQYQTIYSPVPNYAPQYQICLPSTKFISPVPNGYMVFQVASLFFFLRARDDGDATKATLSTDESLNQRQICILSPFRRQLAASNSLCFLCILRICTPFKNSVKSIIVEHVFNLLGGSRKCWKLVSRYL